MPSCPHAHVCHGLLMRVATLTKPCQKTRNRAFIDPGASPDRSVRAALRLCQMCPARVECAKEALTAGSSVDGSTRSPAADVIQAGVVCRGDEATAVALSEVAGVDPPTITKNKRRRSPARHCRECAQPMRPWTRGEVEPGYVMHHARGWCVDCRRHYVEFMREQRDDRPVEVTRKRVDRRSNHLETTVARVRTRGRREGWTQEQLEAAVAEAEALVEQEKAQRSAELRAVREEEKRRVRAEAEAAGWGLTVVEIVELTGCSRSAVVRHREEGRLRVCKWPGVAAYLYRWEDVLAIWD